MAQFKYKAQSLDQKKITGTMNAADERELYQRLREQNLFLLSAQEVKSVRRNRRFKPKVLAEFCRELSTLIGAGVTLVRALAIIANGDAVKPRQKAVYTDLLTQIRQGIALSDAMEAEGDAFPPLMIYMFRSAETSGNMDQVAMKMAQLQEKDHKLNAKISSSMVYPKILGAMIIAVIFIVTNFLLPQFDELFSQMGSMPLSTTILMGVGHIMQNYWYLIIAAGVGIYFGVKALIRVPSVRLKWHRFKLKVPVFGKLQKVVCTSRFARTLSSLYSAGIPIVPALQITRKTIGNDYIDQQFDQVIPFVRAGNNLSEGLDMVDGFVRKLTDSIRVGEETGSLDTMLLATADSLEYDAEIAINKMVSYVEPIMLMVMGLIVAFVLIAIFSALYGSYGAIGSTSGVSM